MLDAQSSPQKANPHLNDESAPPLEHESAKSINASHHLSDSNKSPIKNETLVLANNKQIQSVNSETRIDSTNLNTTLNLTAMPISLTSANENIYFMMQTATDLACTHQSSSPVASTYSHSFKTTPLNSPTNNSKLYLSQHQLQSILNQQSTGLPPINTLQNSPLITNSISLASNITLSPSLSAKNSFVSSLSSTTSVNTGVKVVRDERRRANHNEGNMEMDFNMRTFK